LDNSSNKLEEIIISSNNNISEPEVVDLVLDKSSPILEWEYYSYFLETSQKSSLSFERECHLYSTTALLSSVDSSLSLNE